MATKRPFQKYEITQPAKAEDHGGDEIACTVSVGYTSGNDVVRTRTTYDNRLVFRFDGAQLKIIEVSPALGTVVADTPVFQAEGQSKAAKDFVKSCVLSGGSLSGYTPEQIGALYVDAPVDDGKKTTRQQIIDSTRTYAERWVQRKYTLLEEPQIHQGAGTPLVEVHVALEYVASQAPVGPLPAKTVEPLPAKTQTGRIKTSYTVQFDLEGRPLIHTHAKLD